jgi:hypothetical protein
MLSLLRLAACFWEHLAGALTNKACRFVSSARWFFMPLDVAYIPWHWLDSTILETSFYSLCKNLLRVLAKPAGILA